MFEKLLLATSIWVSAISSATVATPLSLDVPVGLDTWQSPDVWSIPVYTASPADPDRQLLYNPYAWYGVASGRWKRFGNDVATEAEILGTSKDKFPASGNVFSSISPSEWRLPENFNKTANPPTGVARFKLAEDMRPAPGPDGHMAVMQPDGKVLETYGTIRLSSGTTVALSYAVTDPNGLGDGYQNGQTASMLPSYLGLIDDEEISAGAIDHAMAITVPAKLLATEIAYPAFAFDRNAMTEDKMYRGKLPMGARLAIPANVDLATLDLESAPGRVIAQAAQRYGFIIVDRGGDGISLRVRQNGKVKNEALHTKEAAFHSDLEKVVAVLSRVQ